MGKKLWCGRSFVKIGRTGATDNGSRLKFSWRKDKRDGWKDNTLCLSFSLGKYVACRSSKVMFLQTQNTQTSYSRVMMRYAWRLHLVNRTGWTGNLFHNNVNFIKASLLTYFLYPGILMLFFGVLASLVVIRRTFKRRNPTDRIWIVKDLFFHA